MKWALIGVPTLALAGIAIGGPANAGDVRPGQWEFTTRLEAFASAPQSPQAAPPTLSGGGATYLSCIQSDQVVPFQFDGAQCKLDKRDRQGPRIGWSMTCTNSKGSVHSDGVAQYHGDTMEGTLVNHFPAANGTVTDLTQRITGRFIGPCPQAAQGTPTPQRSNSPSEASANASGSSSRWVEPPAAPASSESAKPGAAAPQEGTTVAPALPHPAQRYRYVHHRRHYYRRYYAYRGGGWPGGGLFGIRIPFLGGL